MGRYYCEYCDIFLTVGSEKGRKYHQRGSLHKRNVQEYYTRFLDPNTITTFANPNTSTQWNGYKAIQLLQRLSLKQCMEFLLNGYIKQYATQFQFSRYPFVLQQISIKFLGAQNFFIRFKSSLTDQTKIKLENEHHAYVIDTSSDSTGIHLGPRSKSTTLFIDLPIPAHDDSIKVKWNIKLTGDRITSGHYFVGIVSHDNKYKTFDDTIWSKTMINTTRRIYGISDNSVVRENQGFLQKLVWNRRRSRTFGTIPGSDDDVNIKGVKRFKVGGAAPKYKHIEILSCEYDGNLRQFTIAIERKELCVIKLSAPTNDIKYFYPAIGLHHANDCVEIL